MSLGILLIKLPKVLYTITSFIVLAIKYHSQEVNKMTFNTWLKETHRIDHKTFGLRHPVNQQQIIEEFNEYQRHVRI